MREYLESFMHECEYPTEAIFELLAAFDKISAAGYDEICALLSEYDLSYDIDYDGAMAKMRSLASRCGVHEYTADLLLFLCLTRALRRYYQDSGIPDDIFKSTVLDLKYKLDECKCVYGVCGSFVAKWFVGFFKLERFALGRLQFEIIPFGSEYEVDGVHLMPGTRVINVHIPRTGARLDHESAVEAYRLAAEFYRPLLGDTLVFTCSSWLLFPRHREMLPQGANIIRFMDDYHLTSSGEYKDYSEVWRLFDVMYDGCALHLPSNSSLRRAYIDLIERGEPTGWGKGVFVYNENI